MNFENMKSSKAIWEASRQVRAAAQMIEIATRDADEHLSWRIAATIAAYGLSEKSAQALSRIADEIMFKERSNVA